MSDDDFVEGNSESAAADAPGVVPADDASSRDTAKQGSIDSGSVHDSPVLHIPRSTARKQDARKAFAEAILASKKETVATAATAKPSEVDELDPEAPDVAAVAAAKPVEAIAAKVAAPAIAAPAVVAPPAPSLDPEVRQLREQLKAEREAIATERSAAQAEIDKQKKEVEAARPDTHSLESYIDSPPTAYRNWLESMRGEKFATDDEFKSEVSDFITMLSSDVLGVPLPENVRTKLDAAQAKKIVRTHKTIQTRKEAAAATKLEQERASASEKAEVERVETEWGKATTVLSQQFAAQTDVDGKPQPSATAKAYPWLATEENPGHAIVDTIRHAFKKDGTQLSWQEAARLADEYIAGIARPYYDKRKHLLTSESVAAAKPSSPKPAEAVVVTPAPAPKPAGEPKKWSRERDAENAKAAFRVAFAAKQE